MESRYFLVCLWFCTLVTLTASRTLCPRIFFQNIDENKMPYKLIEGVFVKQSYTHNGFPVYLRENDNLLLYYSKHSSGDSLLFGLNFNHYFGIAARVLSYVTPSSWLASAASLNRKDVFSGLIYRWVYWNDRDNTNYYVDTPPTIKAVCVEDDFRECNSDRIYMNVNFNDGSGNILNNAKTDYFSRIPGRFRNLRPVYRHNTQLWYLQYTSDQYWLVTSTYTPTSSLDSGVYMKVNDLALRPEYITKTWSVHYNGWRDNYSLKVRCRGVSSMVNMCPTSPCRSGSTCVYTSGNETLCICASGYTGVRCDINKQCSTPQPYYSTEFGFRFPGKRPGDLAMTFCRERYPSKRFAICEDETYSSYWTRQGQSCTSLFTSRPIYTNPVPSTIDPYKPRVYTPKPEPINFDDIPGLLPGILVTSILLQIFLPFIIWCCAICMKSCKEHEEEMEDARRRQQFDDELGSRLQNVTRAESQDELQQGVQNYREAVQQYQRETEETEAKRKKGIYRNASYFRLTSMHMYFSFYLWLIYLLTYEALGQQLQGSIFFALYVIAVIMLVVAPIVVLIESAFSHELDYIKNIMEDETAWSYIHRMHQVAPVINMKVECYHWETRTRVVYYTDANGNTQSRTETYQEKVVTFVDCDTFSYGSWVDISKREMPTLSTIALTRLKIDLHILFGDQETENEFERQKENMLERNRHMDEFMDFSCNKEVPGLAKRISAYVDLHLKPWWIRPMYFWLATLLFMTWPYRWLFRAKTAKNYYDLKKKIYKSTTPPREVDVMDSIALVQQSQMATVHDHVNPSFSMAEIPSAEPQPPPYPAMAPAGTVVTPYPAAISPAGTVATPYPATIPPAGTVVTPYPAAISPAGTVATPYPAAISPAGTVVTPYPSYAPATAPYPPSQSVGQAFLPPGMQAVPNDPPPSYETAVNQNPPNTMARSAPTC